MGDPFEFHTSVTYDQAAVRFNIGIGSGDGGPATFDMTVDEAETGKRIPLNHQACPAVHDFTRGYARWLSTKGVQAERGSEAVAGPVHDGLTVAQRLQLARDAVDMIDQRFANYKSTVLTHDGFSDIVFEKNDGVARLMINRPEVYNAKRGITMNEMAEALLDAAGDGSIRVVVISGAGPNGFCTGNDQSYDPSLEQADYAGTAKVSHSQVIRQMPQPVIAAVDGFAIGSGNIMAYECDYTIATTRSRFGQTGPRVGSPANGHVVAMLAARVGQKRAREMWNLCQQFTAQEAYEMGLVNKVVEPEALWDEVDRWVAAIKATSPVIIQMQKISFNRHDSFDAGAKSPFEEHMPDYTSSEECLERRSAFLERRPMDPAKNMPYVKIPIQ